MQLVNSDRPLCSTGALSGITLLRDSAALTLGFAAPGARPGTALGLQSEVRETELMGQTGARSCSGKIGGARGQREDTSSGWRTGREAGAD